MAAAECCHRRSTSLQPGLPLVSTFVLITFVAGQLQVSGEHEREPEFLSPLENATVAQGRDIHFTCTVNHLGNYRVAWIKSDTKAILAMHTRMVTQNSRLSVTHNGHNTWKLYIHNVQSKDSGTYMCQVNTDPMKSQMGHLTVVVPPNIIDEETTDTVVVEGGSVELQCRASGEPAPAISWRRDGGRHIVLRDDTGKELQVVETVLGDRLKLTGLQRADMGQYHCIASNGVPPTQSKRYDVSVLFAPTVRMVSPLLQATVGATVILQCYVEASPKSLNTWHQQTKGIFRKGYNKSQVPADSRRIMMETILNEYALRMNLTIVNMARSDFGEYYCTAQNGFGEAEGVIKILEMAPKTTTTTTTTTKATTTRTTSTTSATTTTIVTSTPRPPRKKPKPKLDINIGQGYNAIAVEERGNATYHDYSHRGDKLKVRPSGPPRYVTYNDASFTHFYKYLFVFSFFFFC